jgi:hypothetical protein
MTTVPLEHLPTDPVGDRQDPLGNPFRFPVSSMQVRLSPDELAKAQRKAVSHSKGAGATRLALLGVVLAGLEDVPFEDVARVLKVREDRLQKMMHGVESIPKGNDERWETIAEILRLLHSVLKPSATARWLRTSIDGLNGRTPIEAIQKGKAGDVLRVVQNYRESSFS